MCTSFFGCWLLDKVIYLEAVKLAKYIFFSGKKQARKLNINIKCHIATEVPQFDCFGLFDLQAATK